MDIKAYGETAKATFFSATFEDFKTSEEESKVREWQEAYFELLSLQNTYGAFYEMTISDCRISQGVYSVAFRLVAKKAFARSVRDWLNDHFCKVSESEWTIGLIETFDTTDLKGNEVELTAIYEG